MNPPITNTKSSTFQTPSPLFISAAPTSHRTGRSVNVAQVGGQSECFFFGGGACGWIGMWHSDKGPGQGTGSWDEDWAIPRNGGLGRGPGTLDRLHCPASCA